MTESGRLSVWLLLCCIAVLQPQIKLLNVKMSHKLNRIQGICTELAPCPVSDLSSRRLSSPCFDEPLGNGAESRCPYPQTDAANREQSSCPV